MATTRRGLFGIFAGAAVAAPAVMGELADASPMPTAEVGTLGGCIYRPAVDYIPVGEIRTIAEAPVFFTGTENADHTHTFGGAAPCHKHLLFHTDPGHAHVASRGVPARYVNQIWTGERWAPLDSQDGAETMAALLRKAMCGLEKA
jgi:hypothetical protein